jgi:flagellar hook-associated protein FlgK
VSPGDTNNPAQIRLQDSKGTIISNVINNSLNTGKIGAILDVCGNGTDRFTIKGVLSDYDALANGFSQIINDIQTKSTLTEKAMAMDSTTKKLIPAVQNIFSSTDGNAIGASNIKINNNLLTDPYLVAVAKVNPADYDVNGIGNNSSMLDVLKARLSNSNLLGNATPEAALANIVGSIGLKVSNINNNLQNQQAVLTQAKNQLSSVTGVNIDEELMDLTKYQTAYKASSRVYTICNELLDVLINLGK